MAYGIWQKDINQWVFDYQYIFDVNEYAATDIIYDEADVDKNDNSVYGWVRRKYDNFDFATLAAKFENNVAGKEIWEVKEIH